jgi:hypothetical protein
LLISKSVDIAVVQMFARSNEIGSKIPSIYEIPAEGYSYEKIKEILQTFETMDKDPLQGKVWAYTYATENMHVHHISLSLLIFRITKK